jgi:hypothetical protein
MGKKRLGNDANDALKGRMPCDAWRWEFGENGEGFEFGEIGDEAHAKTQRRKGSDVPSSHGGISKGAPIYPINPIYSWAEMVLKCKCLNGSEFWNDANDARGRTGRFGEIGENGEKAD